MIIAEKKYTIDDLHKNMRVRISQLSNILDTCMILLDTKILADNDIEGTLVYFGSGSTEEYTKWFQQDQAITPIFFDSAELEDGVVYDE
ncbi:MAG: hypothetical protein NC254_09955 [bacterium]|nr:hypothetical protein [bacterium]